MKGFKATQGVELVVLLGGWASSIFFEIKGGANSVGRSFFNRLKPRLNAIFHQDDVFYFLPSPRMEGAKNKQQLEEDVFAHVLGECVT